MSGAFLGIKPGFFSLAANNFESLSWSAMVAAVGIVGWISWEGLWTAVYGTLGLSIGYKNSSSLALAP